MLRGLLGTNRIASFKQSKVEQSKNPLLNNVTISRKQTLSGEPSSATFQGQKRTFQRVSRIFKEEKKHEERGNKVSQLKNLQYNDKNLSLFDYLKLTSLNRKLSRSKELKKMQSVHKKSTHPSPKKTSILDHKSGIMLIHKQTEKQLQQVEKQFKKILRQMNQCQQITDDEESLVFLCNIFNIFEQRICMSVKLAKELINQQKKKKEIKRFIEYGEKKIDPSKIKHRSTSMPSQFFRSAALIHK